MVRLSALNDSQRFTGLLLVAFTLHFIILFLWDIQWKQVLPFKKTAPTQVHVTLQSINEPLPSSELGSSTQAQHNLQQKEPMLVQKHRLKEAQSHEIMNRRTISGAAHEERDASYLERWQSYVEQYGNTHYPAVAMKNNLRGDLRLLVAINKDGTIKEVKIRQSSGNHALDQAAIKLVYQAGPFEPLPPKMAHDTEILEIIRTWQFRGKLTTS